MLLPIKFNWDLYLDELMIDAKKLNILAFRSQINFDIPASSYTLGDICHSYIRYSLGRVSGRVLAQYRAGLKPEKFEVLICTWDWLFGKKMLVSTFKLIV